MKRWFASDAGRWCTIGFVGSSLLWTVGRGPHDNLTLLFGVLLLVCLLALITMAVHGARRPWLRTLDLEERPDGQLVLPDLDVTVRART